MSELEKLEKRMKDVESTGTKREMIIKLLGTVISAALFAMWFTLTAEVETGRLINGTDIILPSYLEVIALIPIVIGIIKGEDAAADARIEISRLYGEYDALKDVEKEPESSVDELDRDIKELREENEMLSKENEELRKKLQEVMNRE